MGARECGSRQGGALTRAKEDTGWEGQVHQEMVTYGGEFWGVGVGKCGDRKEGAPTREGRASVRAPKREGRAPTGRAPGEGKAGGEKVLTGERGGASMGEGESTIEGGKSTGGREGEMGEAKAIFFGTDRVGQFFI